MDSDIRIVMVQTSHPGNIGAAARAMKNMCLSRLTLVDPRDFPCEEAMVRASGADDGDGSDFEADPTDVDDDDPSA